MLIICVSTGHSLSSTKHLKKFKMLTLILFENFKNQNLNKMFIINGKNSSEHD